MDIQWLYGFIGILSGILLGGGVVWFSLQQRLADKNRLLQDNIAQLALLDETGVRLHTGSRPGSRVNSHWKMPVISVHNRKRKSVS